MSPKGAAWAGWQERRVGFHDETAPATTTDEPGRPRTGDRPLAGLGRVIVALRPSQNPENHSTYPVFRDAARAWWNGVNVYDFDVFHGDYRYGPSFALVLCLLAWLPFRAGADLGPAERGRRLLGDCGLVPSRLSRRRYGPWLRNFVLIAALLPAAHCLYSGQTNLLVFSLVAFAAIAILDERWWLAALLLAVRRAHQGLAAGRGTAAGRLLAAAAGVAVADRAAGGCRPAAAGGAALRGARPIRTVVSASYRAGPVRHTYRDAWTIWELISGPVNAKLYAWVQLGSAAIMLGLCLRQRPRLPPRLVLFVLACWTAWQLVFGPGTERNTFGLIAPLTGWAVVAALRQRRAAWLMGLSYFLTVISAVGGVEDLNPWLKTLHPLGILLFFAWFLWWNALECGTAMS